MCRDITVLQRSVAFRAADLSAFCRTTTISQVFELYQPFDCRLRLRMFGFSSWISLTSRTNRTFSPRVPARDSAASVISSSEGIPESEEFSEFERYLSEPFGFSEFLATLTAEVSSSLVIVVPAWGWRASIKRRAFSVSSFFSESCREPRFFNTFALEALEMTVR